MVDRGALAVVVLGALVVVALLWLASAVQQTTERITRGHAELAVSGSATTELLNYQRLANLDLLMEDPLLKSARAGSEARIRSLMVTADRVTRSELDEQLIAASTAALEDYFATRQRLESQALPLDEILAGARPSFDEAYRRLGQLRQLSHDQVVAAQHANHRVVRLATITAYALAVLVVVSLVTIVLGARRWFLDPILRLRRTIERYRDGEPERADERGPVEIAEIARAFNDMSSRLEQRRRDQLAYLGGVAHDIRNPLGVLELGLEALARYSSDPRAEGTVARLGRQLELLSRLTGDLTGVAGLGAGALQLQYAEFDLRVAVEQVVGMYRPSSTIHRFEVEVPDEPLLIRADRDRIEQVLVNLLTNALRYSPSGGRIVIRAGKRHDRIEIEVTDEGIGIAADDLPTIFEPFQRRADSDVVGGPGAGLGLWIVRRILQSHGGGIEVDSQLGRGSTFRAWLPATCQVAAAPQPEPSS